MNMINLFSPPIAAVVFVIMTSIFAFPLKKDRPFFQNKILWILPISVMSILGLYLFMRIQLGLSTMPSIIMPTLKTPSVDPDNILYKLYYYSSASIFAFVACGLSFYLYYFVVKFVNRSVKDKGLLYISFFILSILFCQFIRLLGAYATYYNVFLNILSPRTIESIVISLSATNNILLFAAAIYFDHNYGFKDNKLYNRISDFFDQNIVGVIITLMATMGFFGVAKYFIWQPGGFQWIDIVDKTLSSIVIVFWSYGVIKSFWSKKFRYVLPIYALSVCICGLINQWLPSYSFTNYYLPQLLRIYVQSNLNIICIILGVQWVKSLMQDKEDIVKLKMQMEKDSIELQKQIIDNILARRDLIHEITNLEKNSIELKNKNIELENISKAIHEQTLDLKSQKEKLIEEKSKLEEEINQIRLEKDQMKDQKEKELNKLIEELDAITKEIKEQDLTYYRAEKELELSLN